MKKDIFVIILIFVISFFTLKDLWKPEFYTSHDGAHQVVRLYYWDQAIKDGHIPPRWVGGLLNGAGYPLFIFSYHMPWIIAEPFVLAGFSIIEAIEITFFLGFALSGTTMYILQKALYGRFGALVGTTIYLFAPYRFSNIFVRGAIGDATTFIFIPLLFLSLYKIVQEKSISWIYVTLGALSLAAILLSHAMVFLFIFLAMFLFFFYFLPHATNKKIFSLNTLFIIAFGFAISSYYFLPSLLERNLTMFPQVIKQVFSGQTFLTIRDLLYTPWGYGLLDAKIGRMSFQVGIAQWIAFLISLLVLVWEIIKRKTNKLALFYVLLFLLSIFMMLEISYPIWLLIEKIAIIDFSWRILPLTVFSASVLAGFIISRSRIGIIFGILLISLAVYGNRNHLRINKPLDWDIPFYLTLEKTTNSYDEYTPLSARQDKIKVKRPKIDLVGVKGTFKILKNSSNKVLAEVNTETSGHVSINNIYYPGWEIKVNGIKTNIFDYYGFLGINVPRGFSKIEAKFTETPLRKAGNIITLVSMLFLFYKVFRSFKKKKKLHA